jgi:hypothetical protein
VAASAIKPRESRVVGREERAMIQAPDLPNRRPSRTRYALQAAGGLLAIFIGSWVVFYIYVYARTIPPGLMGFDRLQRIHERLFLSLNVIPLAIGILAIFTGLAMIFMACFKAFGKVPLKIIVVGVTILLTIGGFFLAVVFTFR